MNNFRIRAPSDGCATNATNGCNLEHLESTGRAQARAQASQGIGDLY